jgi:hypothetical protein
MTLTLLVSREKSLDMWLEAGRTQNRTKQLRALVAKSLLKVNMD